MKITYMNPTNSHPHFWRLKTSKNHLFIKFQILNFAVIKKKGDMKPTDMQFSEHPSCQKS